MRTLVCRALLLAGLAAALPTVAVAYPITVTISTVASGYIDSSFTLSGMTTTFSNKTVTLQGFFTTELTGCIICVYQDGFSFIDGAGGLTTTVTIEGVGTYEDDDTFARVNPGELILGDIAGYFALNVESSAITATNFYTPFGPITGTISEPDLGPDCYPKTFHYCPVHMITSGGDLVLTSVADTATGEVQAASSVPEPGTLELVGMGMLGVGGFLRRRLWRRLG